MSKAPATIAAWVGLALAALAAAALLLLPTGRSESVSTTRNAVTGAVETTRTSSTRTTLLESEGPGVVGVLAVPVLIAAGCVVAARRRRIGIVRLLAGLALGFVLLGALTIGLFFLPSALALLVAASIPERTARLRA